MLNDESAQVVADLGLSGLSALARVCRCSIVCASRPAVCPLSERVSAPLVWPFQVVVVNLSLRDNIGCGPAHGADRLTPSEARHTLGSG
jgi:hypothetical protein